MKKRNLVLFGTVATLSLALAGSIGAVTASAASITNESQPKTGTMTVKYEAGESWTVEIPESITVGDEAGVTVSASDVTIEKGKELNVTVSSANNWKVQGSDADHSMEYELKKDGAGAAYDNSSNNEVLSVAAGTTGKQEVTLKANLKNSDDANYATSEGGYSDTLTFTVEVTDVTP